MFLHKVNIKLCPRLACHRLLVSLATRVSEVSRGEDQVVRRNHDLIRCVRDLSGVGEVHGCLNLLDNGLKWLVNILWRIYERHVELEVCWGDLVVVRLEAINHLQAC